ncbi:MATE family efflux transporter [Acuticoccus sp. MNP-M23]|uniref:MATE family efflux transporter n=1 Tax=Acuticoccus sp. MNP-M23 TaxID=3072793 RepID=UPI0028164711|nr:MATE family efflux transporter [Acuticoccus sp. MNP-M23]WMS44238.1 MATE family efflux transporter [Acuticoccus sp. MNP-M23]
MAAPLNPPARTAPVTLRMVLAIALPMTIAHATTPLIGITDMAVIGQLGSAALIGAVALGALLFDFVGASFNFLRHGTTGLIAQAVGAGDREGEAVALWRALAIAAVLGLAIALLQWPMIAAFIAIMDPSEEVAEATRTYFAWRVWGSPFMLANYAILGWLLGLARAGTGLALQVLLAGVNIALSLALVLGAGLGVAGVAIASVAAEAVTFAAGVVLIARSLRTAPRPPWSAVFERLGFTRTLVVNRDILIRSWLLVSAFALFTAAGARAGDVTLAANAILLNIFLLTAHVLDALATAAEQLGGKAVGARDRGAFRATLRLTLVAGVVVSVALAGLWMLAGPHFIALMTSAADVRASAGAFLGWVALTAVTGMIAFVMDGLFIGATWTAAMRNMMLLSTGTFFAACWLLTPYLGNHGLWLALNVWLMLRGLSLWVLVPRESRRTFG